MKSTDKLPLHHSDFENHENVSHSDIILKHHPISDVINPNFSAVDIKKEPMWNNSPQKCVIDVSDATKENRGWNVNHGSSLNVLPGLKLIRGVDSNGHYAELKLGSCCPRSNGITPSLKANMNVTSKLLTDNSVLDFSSLNIPPYKNIPIAPFCNFLGFDSDDEEERGMPRLLPDDIAIIDLEDTEVIDGEKHVSWRLSHVLRTIFQFLIPKGEHERPYMWFKCRRHNKSKV